MTALHSYYAKAVDLAGEELLGRYVNISGLTTTTVVSADQLAFGGVNEQRYAQWWMWRASTATTADKVRNCDEFAPATGTLTHSGTNYSDTTATDEVLYLLPPWLDPYKARNAVNEAVQKVRELDETVVPVRRLVNGEYYLSDLDWIDDAASIRAVKRRQSPILSRNRDFDKWHTVSSGGVLTPPDHWTLAGASATVTRGTSNLYDGPYVATVTRSGTDCTLTQSVGILPTGVSGDSLRTRTVTAVIVVRASVASQVRVWIYENGTATASSSYHTGGGTYEELSCSATVASTTDTLTFGVSVETDNTAVNVARCWLQDGSVTDSTRRDDYPWTTLAKSAYQFEQGGPLKVKLGNLGFPAQFVVCSERPYPAFDSTRLTSGAADTDESDAPLVPVATGVVAILLEQHLGTGHQLAREWRRKFDAMCMKHLAIETDGPGFTVMGSPLSAPAMRVR